MSKSNLALNRAIAEKIMGWVWMVHDEYPDIRGLVPPGTQAAWLSLAKGAERMHESLPHRQRVADYCGDANQTMKVVEEMSKTHTFAASLQYGWTAIFQRRSTMDWSDRGEAKEQSHGRAVCLAALRARGHSVEEL